MQKSHAWLRPRLISVYNSKNLEHYSHLQTLVSYLSVLVTYFGLKTSRYPRSINPSTCAKLHVVNM